MRGLSELSPVLEATRSFVQRATQTHDPGRNTFVLHVNGVPFPLGDVTLLA